MQYCGENRPTKCLVCDAELKVKFSSLETSHDVYSAICPNCGNTYMVKLGDDWTSIEPCNDFLKKVLCFISAKRITDDTDIIISIVQKEGQRIGRNTFGGVTYKVRNYIDNIDMYISIENNRAYLINV